MDAFGVLNAVAGSAFQDTISDKETSVVGQSSVEQLHYGL